MLKIWKMAEISKTFNDAKCVFSHRTFSNTIATLRVTKNFPLHTKMRFKIYSENTLSAPIVFSKYPRIRFKFLLKNIDAARAKNLKSSSSSPENSFPSHPLKDGKFSRHVFCDIYTLTPAHWHPKLPIEWCGSIFSVSVAWKRACSSIPCRKFHSNGKRLG